MGIIDITSLKVGDLVRSCNGELSRVYSFSHLDRFLEVEFLQFLFENDKDIPLEVTANHMIFLASGDVVRASQIGSATP
jgi:hypothetical protein